MAMLEIFTNNAITTIATGGLSISSTTLNLASGTGGLFPNPAVGTQFFRISLTDAATRTAHEITYCTARSGDICTIVRAQEGTTAQAWLINDIAGHFVTAGAMTNTTQQSAIQNNTYISALDTGTVNTYQIALTPAMQTSLEFAEVIFRVLNTNTGASTLQINTGTIYTLYGLNGTALQGGELVAGGECKVIFNGTSYYVEYCTTGALQIVDGVKTHQAISYGQLVLSAQQNKYIYGADTGTANTYKPVISPAPTITAGSEVLFTVGNTNTTASTIQINGTGTIYNLYGLNNTVLQGGELFATGKCRAIYNGTQFIVEYCSGGSLQIVNATQTHQALAKGQVGTVASENIGEGLEDDGSGNLRIKTSDFSIRRSSLGIQTNDPITYFSGAVSIALANHMNCFVSTANGTLTIPLTTTTFNGFSFSVNSLTGTVVVTPNAADKINNGTIGASYTVPNGTSAFFVCDGIGAIDVFYQSFPPGASPAPQYLATSQTIASGQYTIDTSAGIISLTLPPAPVTGSPIVLLDAQDTWAVNNVILINSGGSTINGSTANFNLDVFGAQVLLIYKSGNWSIV